MDHTITALGISMRKELICDMRKLLFVFTISLVFVACDSAVNDTSPTPIETPSKTTVEDVRINKQHSNAWAVTGMIRNESSSIIKGAVKIKFVNSKGDIVHSNRTKVNDGDPINPGQAGSFEYFTKPTDFDDVTSFNVEFYER